LDLESLGNIMDVIELIVPNYIVKKTQKEFSLKIYSGNMVVMVL